jgi:hypothetical protein
MVKPQEEWVDLSIQDKPKEPPTWKTKQVFHTKSIFLWTWACIEHSNKALKAHMWCNQQLWCQEYKFELSTNDAIKLLTQEPLFIVRHRTYNPVSNNHLETGKIESLSRSYLSIVHSTWTGWWRSCSPQDGTHFLIGLASEVSQISPHRPLWKNLTLICTYMSITIKWMESFNHAYDIFEMPILNLHFSILMTIRTWCHHIIWAIWIFKFLCEPMSYT